jgi:outer membrane protein assembly factor BamA
MYRAQRTIYSSLAGQVLIVCLWLDSAPVAGQTDYRPLREQISLEQLESDGATIGEISFQTDNIFDLDNPAEDKWLYRVANSLHAVTRPNVIQSQLLFSEGDAFSERVVEESERILRQNNYLRDAQVEPISYDNGIVDLRVRTKDVWTLTPSISAGRSGGENRLGIGLKESNLFGTGVLLGFKFKRTVDRDTAIFDYSDRNFRGSRKHLAARIGENSDGYDRRFQVVQPFYALDARRAGGLSLHSEERIDPLYERGEIISNFLHTFQYHEAFSGWSGGLNGDWTRRITAGLVYDDHEFTETPDTINPELLVPADRRFIYPFVGFELIEDDFQEGVNFDRISIIEDRFLGTRVSFRLGYSSASAGSTANAWHFRGYFSNALVATQKDSVVVMADLDGRYADGEGQNVELSAGTRYHHRWSERHLFYASLSGTVGRNLDLDNQLLLGGDNGLRGYPLRYQGGDSMALLTLEHRIFTEWYPFRLVNVGGAIFFDAGRTWGENPVGGENLGLLRDVGFGLRLGNNRSGEGRIIHIDIAFPLDGEDTIDRVQLLVDARTSF